MSFNAFAGELSWRDEHFLKRYSLIWCYDEDGEVRCLPHQSQSLSLVCNWL